MKETDKKKFVDDDGANLWQRLKDFLKTWLKIDVGKSLFIWFLVISFVPLAVVSYIDILNAYSNLSTEISKSLNSSSQLRLKDLYSFFDDASDYLSVNAASKQKKQQFIRLADAFHNSKMSAEKFVGTSEYKKLTRSLDEEIAPSLKPHKFYDLIFMDPKGNIIFRTKPDDDLGRCLFRGRLNSTRFAITARKSVEENKMLFSDLEHYSPNMGGISGFFTIPVMEGKRIVGIMALQISVSSFNKIIQQDAGYGKTGEAFLIGSDLRLRSATRFGSEEDILKEKIVNKKTLEWRDFLLHRDDKAYLKANKLDEEQVTTYKVEGKENYVMGIYRNLGQLDKYGVHWALIEQISRSEAFAYVEKLSRMVKLTFLITIIVVIIISMLVTHWFVSPLKQLSSWGKQITSGHLIEKDVKAPHNEVGEMKDTFNRLVKELIGYANVAKLVAKGDFSETVQERSDKDVLASSLNQMVESFRSVVAQANRIAEGDYNTMIRPRSDRDALGKALFKMTETLRKNAEEFQNENWVKSGLNELDGVLKGKSDIRELTNAIISFFTDYLGAQVGLIYLYHEQDDLLKLSSTYAIPHDKEDILADYRPGEGVIGQAFSSKKRVVISHNVKTPLIDMGLGKKGPRNLAVIPFCFENQVVGVMEVGSVNAFTPLQLQFIEMAAQDLALAVITLNSHIKLQELLTQTQEQAKILEVQQEELRQANEELQEQTEALKYSEENLQSQQEELKVTNEELEERTKALEIQRDAIKRKNLELEDARREIEKKASDLELASRYKSEFLANMSHELRTPLNSIIVLSQLLDENKTKHLSEKEREFAQTINFAGQDLLGLINDILDLSKVESGKLELNVERTYVQDITYFVESNFKPVLERKGLELIIKVGKEAPAFIETDIQRVQQIVKNLISNAIKFTEKGNITFKVDMEKDPDKISKLGLNEKEMVTMTVSDTGIGIPQKKQKMIFEAFNQADGTTSRKYGGTGLGLSISTSLSQLLGGAINLESEENKGSSFTLFLPLVYKEPEEKEELEEVEPEKTEPKISEFDLLSRASMFKEKKVLKERPVPTDDRDVLSEDDKVILIIEDDMSFVGVLLNLAHEHGFKGIIAPDGETGLSLTGRYKPDAIILDISLPVMDGREVLDKLKDQQETRSIPVHVISAKDFDMTLMRKGILGFLMKPVTKEQLDEVFNKIETAVSKPLKRLLIAEDDKITRKNLEKLLGSNSLEITSVDNGEDALMHLEEKEFDCMILDLGLKKISGYEVLEKMQKIKPHVQVPVVIYTGQELTQEEDANLKKYAKSIVLKGAHSYDRLLEETTLFLHQLDKDASEEKNDVPEKTQDDSNILKGKTILIVDDDMRNVFALAKLLETYDINVIVARNGKVGLEKLKQNDQIDLVLMDIMMPEMDGYEAMRHIRKEKKYKNLPIIALTAKALKDDREKCLAAGANEYLSKPVERDKLISLLRVWLYK